MRSLILISLTVGCLSTTLAAQSLTLSSVTAASNPVSTNLSLAPAAGTAVSALQWKLSVAAGVSSLTVKPGAALQAAGKTVTCMGATSGYTCLATGGNSTIIPGGVVADVTVTLVQGVNTA